MPGSGKHNVNNIDSFFKVRPSRTTVREGETISFLENGNLVKQEKRNGVVYETTYVEQGTKEVKSTTTTTSTSTSSGDITSVTAGTGLTGGGVSGPVTLNVVGGTGITANANDIAIDSTVATLTGTQTLSNKTLAAPTLTGTTTATRINLGSTDTSSFLTGDPKISATGYMMIQGIINETETGSAPAGIVFGNNSTYGNDEISLITAGQNRLFINSSGNIAISQDLTVSGDLTVQGDTTTIDTQNLVVEDRLIELAYGSSGTPADTNDSGVIVNRGSSANIFFGWDEGSDRIRFATTDSVGTATTVNFTGNANIQAGRLYGDVTGDLTGNADTATKWAAGVDINISGDVVGTTGLALDGSGDVTIDNSVIQPDAVTFGMLNDNIISGQTAITTGLADTDELLLSDAGALKKVDISVLESKFTSGLDALTLANFDADVVIVDSEVGSVTRNDARFLTASASETFINSEILSYGYTTNTGTVTSVAVSGGNGLTSSGGPITGSGTITLAVGSDTLSVSADKVDISASALTPVSEVLGADGFIFFDASAIPANSPKLGTVSDLPFTNNAGTVTNVVGGAGLTGSGSTSVTLEVGAGTGITVNADNVALSTAGAGAGTYGDTANSVKIDTITLDAYGRVTAVATGGTGDISNVIAGTGLIGGGSAGDVTLDLDSSGLASVATVESSDGFIFFDGSVSSPDARLGTVSDLPFTNNAGTITNIVTGTGISGGPITSTGTLSLALSDVIANSGTANAVLTSDGDGTLTGEANLTFDGDFKVTGTLSTLETVNFDQASGDTAVIISGTGNQRLEFRDSATGANAWIGIPSWNDDAFYIFGPTATSNEHAYTYESSTHKFYTGGSEQLAIFSDGTIGMSGYSVADRHLEIGSSRQANGYAYIDLIGDTTYTDFGARFIRENTGPNTGTAIEHRGTGVLSLNAKDAGSVRFYTSNTERVRIDSSGNIGIGNIAPTSLLTTSGGDIRILGSGNRLRFNTNGSIYWDSSAGIKLENGSAENITIETNTSGDIKFNTANTGTMVLTDDKEVFIGETTQNQNLAFGGTLKTHQYLDTRDYMQHKGHFAESDWIVMESGANHVVTSYFDNTNVYVDGVYKGKIDSAFGQATISSADLSLGSVISADRAVIVHQSGTIRSMCMNTRFSGKLLGSGSTRGYPLTIHIYAPYTSVSYSIYRSSSANVDITATALTTGTISQGGIITFTESDTASGTQFYVIEADGKVCATLDDDANDHLLFTPLAMEVIASSFSREGRGGVTTGIAEDSTNISETQNGTHAFYLKDTSGKYGLFAFGVADGAGSDAEFAMPIEFCSDYYIYGDTDLSNYRLVCFQDTFVKVLDVSGNVLDTHDASSATKNAPLYFDNGTATGAGTFSTAGPFRFVGTAPFYLVCQEPGGQDECTMLGAMQHELSNNQRFKGGAVPNNVVLPSDNQKLIIGANSDLELYAHDPANDSRINVNNNPLLITYNGADRFRLGSGDLVINEGGGDYNFRIEGDSEANLFFVDAGNDRIGIGTSSPSLSYANKGLEIQTTDEQASLRLERTGSSPCVFEISARNSDILLYNNGTARAMRFGMAGTEYMRFATNGRFIVGSNYTTNASTQLVVSSSGANGLLLNQDDSNTANSGRIFFEGTSTAAMYLGGSRLNITSGATTGSSSGSTRFSVYSDGAKVVSGALGVNIDPSTTDGRIDATNDVVAYSTSDKRLKENIKPLDNALNKVLKINGVSFDWKELTEEEKKTIHGNEGHDVGVIAQEIQEVLPEVVTTRDSGYKAVKYEKIVPLLIEAIKEQQKQIEELKNG